jgi:hypothetical protein
MREKESNHNSSSPINEQIRGERYWYIYGDPHIMTSFIKFMIHSGTNSDWNTTFNVYLKIKNYPPQLLKGLSNEK